MLRTTVGQLMVNEALPEELRDYARVLNKKGIKDLLQDVADKHPDRYRDVAKAISDVGRDVSFTSGSHSVGLKSLRQSLAVRRARAELDRSLQKIYASEAGREVKEQKIIDALKATQAKLVDDVMQESLQDQNPLAIQAISGARGNKFNINALRGADLLYVDHQGRDVPIPVMRSYSMGLRPHEYFAGSFGTRKGVYDVKAGTAKGGFLNKQLMQAVHRLLVSGMDADTPYDEATPRGLPVDTDDNDSEGSLLAHPVGGYARNTIITPKILKELRAQGIDQILTRSPTVGGPADGGVYARDAGVRERGGLSPIGDMIGIAGAHAISEPVTQSMLSSKHSGGVSGAGAGAVSGFDAINSMIQVPKTFPGGAAHAQVDGTVSGIREAPQGGHYIQIGNQEHYVGRDYELRVKKGDSVESGDAISSGIPNPAEIVKHKGVGEGRRYFVQAFRDMLRDSGTSGHRRNIELLARGLINHVRLTDEVGDWAPDDVVPYQYLESQWQPRSGHLVVPPTQAKGYYLERPVLHYSVGTRVQPSMIKQLQKYNVPSVYVHQEAPPFEPEMIRGMANISHDPDWMTRMLGSYQKGSVLEGARRGAVSDEAGSSFVPVLARGEDFGRTTLTRGWRPEAVVKPQ